MLPGDAPGRVPPGRGTPGRGACGRGIGRSTGCAEENGLLPTRGVRGAGLGAGLGRGLPRGAGGATGLGAGALAAGVAGRGGSGIAAGAAGVADAAGAAGAAAAAAAFAGDFLATAPLPAGAALPPPNDSRSRRATGASTVDEADLTNSPCSLSRARTSLLVTPSSFANSCTRALPATTSPSLEATAVVGRRPGFSYDTWSSGLHGVLIFFATCSVAGRIERGEVLDDRGCVRRAGDAQRSAEGSPPDRCA
jgi:hypothetical protein